MKQKQFWNFSLKNKKAFIFTTDALVALALVISILFVTNYFVNKGMQDSYTSLQLINVGSDFIHILDYKGYFENINPDAITSYLTTNLPPQYSMNIEGSPNCHFIAGETIIPAEKRIVSGKEFFVTNGNYCSLRFKIWIKQN